MRRWGRFKVFVIISVAWGAASSIADVFDVWNISTAAARHVDVILGIADSAMPRVASIVAIWVVGMLSTYTALWTVFWLPDRVRYYMNDGPKADRFKALAPAIKSCRVRLMRHYENRGNPLVGAYPLASEGASISADFYNLFRRLMELNIPVIEARRYRDDTEGGRQFWLAYLADMETLARNGDLKGARNPKRPHVIWRSGQNYE